MSRFPDTSVACLKRVMLSRAPGFFFNCQDGIDIARETGLNEAQIRVWADHFRMRFAGEKERMDFLSSDGSDKGDPAKVARAFVFAFNVSPDFASSFRMPKSKGVGDFTVKFMEAAFDKDAGSGEFFLEFDDYVWAYKLVEAFQAQGACQVSLVTFVNNDGGNSAADALVRIRSTQAKTGLSYIRGVCPSNLQTKVQAKQAAAAAAALSTTSEFDRKTLAAMAMSLEQSKEVIGKVGDAIGKVDGAVQMQVARLGEHGMKLDEIGDGMQSHGVKLVEIENGVCNVIPDYQRENRELKLKLAHKTVECNRIEGQKGNLTRKINIIEADKAELVLENEQLKARNVNLKSVVAKLEVYVEELKQDKKTMQDHLDLCKGIATLNQIIEDTQYTTGEMMKTLGAEDRAAKRSREEGMGA